MKKQILITAGALLGLTLALGPQVSSDLSPVGSAHASKGGSGGGGSGSGGGNSGKGSSGDGGGSGHGGHGSDSGGSGRGSEGEGARGKSADAPGRAVSEAARDKSLDDGPHGKTVSAVAQDPSRKSALEARGRTAEGEGPRGADRK